MNVSLINIYLIVFNMVLLPLNILNLSNGIFTKSLTIMSWILSIFSLFFIKKKLDFRKINKLVVFIIIPIVLPIALVKNLDISFILISVIGLFYANSIYLNLILRNTENNLYKKLILFSIVATLILGFSSKYLTIFTFLISLLFLKINLSIYYNRKFFSNKIIDYKNILFLFVTLTLLCITSKYDINYQSLSFFILAIYIIIFSYYLFKYRNDNLNFAIVFAMLIIFNIISNRVYNANLSSDFSIELSFIAVFVVIFNYRTKIKSKKNTDASEVEMQDIDNIENIQGLFSFKEDKRIKYIENLEKIYTKLFKWLLDKNYNGNSIIAKENGISDGG